MVTGASFRRAHALLSLVGSLLIALVLALLPLAALAQEEDSEPEVAAASHQGADEVILINSIDGRIVIQDLIVEPNSRDLTGKYDVWGGPYNQVAAGDFDGDGYKELVAIGGAGVTVPGPVMNTFDPVALKAGLAQLPNLGLNAYPNTWLMVRAGDINGDGRDEIVAVRSADEGVIRAHLVAYGFNPSLGNWNTTPIWDLPTIGEFSDMELGDFNADGAADVVLARQGNLIYVLDGRNVFNTFFQAQVGSLSDWIKAKIGNVDPTTDQELILLRPQATTSGNVPPAVAGIRVTGTGTYNDLYDWGFANPPVDIRLCDFNGDGLNEIMALNNGTNAAIYTLNPRLGYNNNIEGILPIGDNLWGPVLVMADVNGDGRPERILVRADGAVLRLYDFHAAGGYSDVTGYGPYWRDFIAADLDGPGVAIRPELSVTDRVALFYDIAAAAGTRESVVVANLGGLTFNWVAISGSCPWLSLSRTVGAAGDTITLSLNAASLPSLTPGVTAQCPVGIQATAPDGGEVRNNNQNITVTVRVVSQLHQVMLPMTLK